MKKINGYNIIRIEEHRYTNNNLALELVCETEFGDEPYAIITTNFGEKLLDGYAYVDTNNCKWVKDFIEQNNLGIDTKNMKQSGWCEYPLYKFNLEKIKDYNNGGNV